MFKKHKDNIKNVLNSVERIIKYSKKRREMALYAVRVLNGDSVHYEKIYHTK